MKKYNIIYADPPWDYGKMKPRKRSHRGGNPQSHYSTLSFQQIESLSIYKISDVPSCLFLWITNPKLPYGFRILESWGFKYQTTLTWVKVRKDGEVNRGGLGFYFRGATEHVLFGTKGKFRIPTNLRMPNVFFAQKSEHSTKPTKMYEIIESLPYDRKVELFARNKRLGWDVWGNEVESDIEL